MLYYFLLLIYATSITYPIPGVIIFSITLIFFVLLYTVSKNKSRNTPTSLIQLMCYSIPLSWRNIFGGEYGDLPVSWFYLIGVLLAVHLILIKNEIKLKPSLAKLSVIIGMILIFSIIPLLITNTSFIKQGVSQFIILCFHHVVILIAILKGNIISKDNILRIEKSYVAVGLVTSLGIITQFILFQLGFTIGTIRYFYNRQMFHFLFSDVSHATLYLATTSLLSIQLLSSDKKINKFKYTVIPIITLIGAAITSARTGLIVFFVVYITYILFGQNGIVKKVISLVAGAIALFGAIAFSQVVRPQSSIYNALFDSSGRTAGYDVAIGMFLEKPFFGYGFSRDYIAGLMNAAIPHFSFLQYLIHAGVFYTVMIFGVIVFAYFYAKKYKMNESWIILLTVIGTCLVPDIFSTRYITLIILIVFLKNKKPEAA